MRGLIPRITYFYLIFIFFPSWNCLQSSPLLNCMPLAHSLNWCMSVVLPLGSSRVYFIHPPSSTWACYLNVQSANLIPYNLCQIQWVAPHGSSSCPFSVCTKKTSSVHSNGKPSSSGRAINNIRQSVIHEHGRQVWFDWLLSNINNLSWRLHLYRMHLKTKQKLPLNGMHIKCWWIT